MLNHIWNNSGDGHNEKLNFITLWFNLWNLMLRILIQLEFVIWSGWKKIVNFYVSKKIRGHTYAITSPEYLIHTLISQKWRLDLKN